MTIPSRRDFLRTSTGLGLAAGGPAPGEAPAEAPAAPVAADGLEVIDVHIHVDHSRLTAAAEAAPPEEGDPLDMAVERRAEVVRAEMQSAGIVHALCMPRRATDEDPLGIAETLRIVERVPGLHPVGIADPRRTDAAHLARVEAMLQRKAVKALKAYLGYLHFGPEHPNYRPYYDLAGQHGIPVVFHTGDTYSHLAKLKYAHPLLVDEVAVDFPRVKFVMAHLGNPWLPDAAEVIYKNNKRERANVWADISAFLVGTAEAFQGYRESGVVRTIVGRIRDAFHFAERPDRFLYGSDWPLAPMAVYRDFMLEAIPDEHHQAVFRDNARALFGL